MLQFNATNVSALFAHLMQLAQVASTSPKEGAIPAEVLQYRIAPLVLQCLLLCAELSLGESLDAARRLENDLSENAPISNPELLWKLENLRTLMQSEMNKQLYFRVEKHLTKYLNAKAAFGREVSKAFPSIEEDLIEAGNCLAFGCNTAAGFHLMRVVEVGLRELGRDRRIPLATKDKIEFSEWGQIIGELEVACKAIQTWPNSRSKEEAHKFYNSAVTEVRAFNDGWRRHCAHPRVSMPPMISEDALALWAHVRRFMQALAEKISEGNYTNPIW